MFTLLFASACVPTTRPNVRWHTCHVPVAGAIDSTVQSALQDMTSLTGITFSKSDLVTASYHGIKFEVSNLPGTSAGWGEPNTKVVGKTNVAQSGLIIWDTAYNPPTARIARHELGHLMGMAHSDTGVMQSNPSSTTWTAAEKSYLIGVGRASGCRK
ncbi:MAG: hypothetical protein JWM47_762 [Acidimicrobiales bacterium]|nr:hypothetical protein [Acidimicrobiales bacterium]